MDILINDQHQDHIKRKIESGMYRTPDDVLATALTLLDEHDEGLVRELEDVSRSVQIGTDQLRKGQYTVYTDETLHELFDGVKQRGRERLAPENGESDVS